MEENQSEKKSINPMLIIGFVAVLAIAGIGYMISNRGNNNKQPTDTQMQAETQTEEKKMAPTEAMMEAGTESAEAMQQDEVKIINVEAGSFYYKPNEIRVKKGQKVKIVMKSVSMMHDFVIDELDVRMPVTKNGETGEVEFTPTQVGEFEYYCSVGQHRANGQVGKIIIEE